MVSNANSNDIITTRSNWAKHPDPASKRNVCAWSSIWIVAMADNYFLLK
jgi:hypothetical protein